ncbi:hypothetical protein [Chitinophaga nivalis]|uniref:Uncharacterized protein n=1 Tax=Chitinophaga nivalis TaxID=2991709 RepID=A0ABT3IRJ6_9BACT|nr:hypothetical protein [Chitinophaga nivalis]MCW3463707.1 hypothetical protein [Chitinophaga nivalis]MCW3486603.1 hypothetical protein [Chitinophaga nivalis]
MKPVIFLTALALLLSCKKETDTCKTWMEAQIDEVAPLGRSQTGGTGRPEVRFKVSCWFSNSCSNIHRLVEKRNGNTYTIRAEGIYDQCAFCATMLTPVSTTYVFNPPAAGTYYLKWEGLPERTDTVRIH